MYANVFTAEKLAAFQQAQLVRDLERRRIVAARTPKVTDSGRTSTPAPRRLHGLVPRFGLARLRPA